jgi:hypothetical protein
VTTIFLLLTSSFILKNNFLIRTDSSKGLKDYYKNYFPIGVAGYALRFKR